MSDTFNHEADAWDSLNHDDDEDAPFNSRRASCRNCGSIEVRWRQQGGRWVLFSLQPGVIHACDQQDLLTDFD